MFIDAHDWPELARLLHADFACRYVHTGEVFDGPAWVRLNAEYPGFEHLVLEDCVGAGDRAAGRAHVTSRGEDGEVRHFEVATFMTVRDGLIALLVEVWTDAHQQPPSEARPS